MDFETMMALERYGDDAWIGTGPQYPWGGLYGGQIVAQGLQAARATVDASFAAHSLHASFLRRGSHTEKILFEVDQVRDGRSFCNRRVVARQAVGTILTMTASFQRLRGPRDEVVQTVPAPSVPPPDELPSEQWSPMFDRRRASPRGPGPIATWMRVAAPVGDDRDLQAAALAYLSDDLPTEAVLAVHPDTQPTWDNDTLFGHFFAASLDHAIWFHRPLRADEWHLHVFTCQMLAGSRGVSVGHVFAGDGRHVATVSQETVVRRRH